MKHYVGVKIVKAEPEMRNSILGYKVIHSDGSISWTSKYAFEKEYRELDCEEFIKTQK